MTNVVYVTKKKKLCYIFSGAVTSQMTEMPDESHEFNASNVIFNTVHQDPGHIINFFVLVGKQQLYTKRCLGKKYSFEELKCTIKMFHNYEKYKAIKEGKLYKHLRKWKTCKNEENEQ